jgi:hypothetical protein
MPCGENGSTSCIHPGPKQPVLASSPPRIMLLPSGAIVSCITVTEVNDGPPPTSGPPWSILCQSHYPSNPSRRAVLVYPLSVFSFWCGRRARRNRCSGIALAWYQRVPRTTNAVFMRAPFGGRVRISQMLATRSARHLNRHSSCSVAELGRLSASLANGLRLFRSRGPARVRPW